MKPKRNTVWIAALLFAFTRSLALAAAGDENWDGSFGVPGANGTVGAIATSGKDVYFGGGFSSVGGLSAANIAGWDGAQWHALGSGLNGEVTTLSAGGAHLYAAGAFTQSGETAVTNIAQWDGTNWSALGEGIDGTVSALAVVGGALFAGGSFSSAGGLAISNIARWNGTNWSAVGGGINGPVTELAVLGGSLYVGGGFTQAGSANATNFAKWEGTHWLAMGDGLPFPPSAMTASDSAVYACTLAPKDYDIRPFTISKWDGAGLLETIPGYMYAAISQDPDDPRMDPRINCIAFNGNDIYIAGWFETFQGEAGPYSPCIAYFDAKEQNWSGLRSGLSDEAFALVATGSELYLGGYFPSTSSAKPSLRIALWHVPHSLSARRSADALTLSWPATGTNFVLEAKSDLTASQWAEVAQKPVVLGDQLVVTNALSTTNQFFRLRRP